MSFEEALSLSGWSYDDLLTALSPTQLGPSATSEKQKRPDTWESPNEPRKLIDLKKTPCLKTKIIDVDLTLACETEDAGAIDRLSLRSLSDAIPDVRICEKEMILRYIDQYDLSKVLPNGWSLYNHQKDSIQKCVLLQRSILALDMGLGKTIIGVVWADILCHMIEGCALIVISPCTLIENWKREAQMLDFDTIIFDSQTKQKSHYQSTKYAIISSWAKMPSPQDVVYLTNGRCNRYILVCDEAHAMQTLYSRRTKAALALCHSPLCRGVILSTGTPMKNGRPANLYPLLLGIQHPIAKNKLDFETRYCAGKKTPYCPWDISGAAHLDELRERIGEHLIRKTKVRLC